MTDLAAVEDKLLALKKKYYLSLPGKLSDIFSIWQTYKNSQTINDKDLETALHKLAGSAGMYDEAELGQIAREAELLVAACESTITSESLEKISATLDRLKNKIDQLSQKTS